eukprot:TRINITY_DN6266_c0_g1_i1.p1 TRINITY_DN6266_c0_g1~~TRINITY_DN6266_c0_g1_i1.p1  ORF type:complete len:647 (-),score=86.04 TRINITY_DN6266_c0_g1_i1:20-1960(-)
MTSMKPKKTRAAVALGIVFVLFLIVASIVSIYKRDEFIPDFSPKSWPKDEILNPGLLVNNIVSEHRPVPYAYNRLPFCVDKRESVKGELLGSYLLGNRLEKSKYDIRMLNGTSCSLLCNKEIAAKRLKKLIFFIHNEYKAQWQLDDLPSAYRVDTEDGYHYDTRWKLGDYIVNKDNTFGDTTLNNHVAIKIYYHLHVDELQQTDQPEYGIVFFEVQPMSIDYKGQYKEDICLSGEQGTQDPLVLNIEGKQNVVYSYSVSWIEDKNTSHSNRWNRYYIGQGNPGRNWFAVINSMLVALFLSLMVAVIITKTLKKDLIILSETDDDEFDEIAWKLVHGDVFRPPRLRILLSSGVGIGVQVNFMTIFAVICSVLGFVSPGHKGEFLTIMLIVFVWMGIVGGYASGRIFKIMGGINWKKNVIVTAILYPGVIFAIVFLLNLFFWSKKSSGAIPFGTLFACIALWFCISLPLSFIGGNYAQKKDVSRNPTDINSIPKFIPEQVWYMRPIPAILIGGSIPFGAIFIEIYYILTSIWHQQEYLFFGFVFIIFLIYIVACIEVSIFMTYFQLCAEDYNWWWRSFLIGACSGFYFFCFSIFHILTRLSLPGFLSVFLYLGYSLIIGIIFGLMAGAITFTSSYIFVKRIYAEIKSE